MGSPAPTLPINSCSVLLRWYVAGLPMLDVPVFSSAALKSSAVPFANSRSLPLPRLLPSPRPLALEVAFGAAAAFGFAAAAAGFSMIRLEWMDIRRERKSASAMARMELMLPSSD